MLQRIQSYYDNQQLNSRIYIYPEELGIDVVLPLDDKFLANGWRFNCERLPADEGGDIYSIADGTVIYADEYGPFIDGTTVIIEHANGYASRYSGCGSVLVKSGQSVKKGELIATLGTDNIITEPYETYLSFDIYKNGYSISIPDHIGINVVYDFFALREKGNCKYDKLIDYVNSVTSGEQIIAPEEYAQLISQ